jgi:energy-converting hydrogenase A subunit R
LGDRFLVSDCEGPLSLNDNAFELAGHFIPHGEKFFQIVSRYDDILVEMERPGYNAGNTLKLIAPFLKAYGATNQNVETFSEENVILVPGAQNTLQFFQKLLPSFIVSTSYQQYIEALCQVTGFPLENCYYTLLDLEKYEIKPDEKDQLRKLKKSAVENPEFENLERIFWDELPQMRISSLMDDIKPVGGAAKKEAVEDIMSRFGFQAADLIYIGDSITDVEPLRFAQDEGGLAVSFNGNSYALDEASVAVISNNTLILSLLTHLFKEDGTEKVLEFADTYSTDPQEALEDHSVMSELSAKLSQTHTQLEVVTSGNLERLKAESGEFRKNIRGEAIGGLG